MWCPTGVNIRSIVLLNLHQCLKNASNKCKFLMYTDDTTIYFNIEDFDTNKLEAEINKELEQVNTWLKVIILSLNVGKTKIMMFH